MSSQHALNTFVALTGELVTDFDVIDFMNMLSEHGVEVLDMTATGFMVIDHRGFLSPVAASTDNGNVFDLLHLQSREGPCHEAYHTRRPVLCGQITTAMTRWPRFATAAAGAGYAAVHAVPMRLREQSLGALTLLSNQPGTPDDSTIALAQTLADLASVALVHDRTTGRPELVIEQLQDALNGRILIEQAKGVLAERLNTSVHDAFTLLRHHAQHSHQRLTDIAKAVVDGSLQLLTPTPAEPGTDD